MGALPSLKPAPPSGGALRESIPGLFGVHPNGGFWHVDLGGCARPRSTRGDEPCLVPRSQRTSEGSERGLQPRVPDREWICECANDSCVERIEVSANEYELVRRDQARFFVAPSNEHVWPEVEQVIERNDHYWIVEKIGHSATAAARLDPLRASRGEAR